MATEEAPIAAPPSTTADDVLLSRLISHMQGGDAEVLPTAEQRSDAPALVKGSKVSDQDIETDGDWKPDAANAAQQSAPMPEAVDPAAASAAPQASVATPGGTLAAPGGGLTTPGEGLVTPGGDSVAGGARNDPAGEAIGGNSGKKLSRRIIANRESAQRSRLRKLQYIADLEANIAGLNSQVNKLGPQLAFLRSQHENFERSNDDLRTQVAQLLQETQYKDNLNDALRAELTRLQGKDPQVAQGDGRPGAATSPLMPTASVAGNVALGGGGSGGPSISASLPLSAQLALAASMPYSSVPLSVSSGANPLPPITSGSGITAGDASGFPNLTPSQFSELQSAIAAGTLSPDLLAALSALPSSTTSAAVPVPSLLPLHGSSVLAAAQAAFLAASAATASLPFQSQHLPPPQPALDTVPLPLLHVSSQQIHLQQQQARGLPLPQQLPQATWQLQPPQAKGYQQQPQLSAQDLLQRLQGNVPAPMVATVEGPPVADPPPTGETSAASGGSNGNRIKRQRMNNGESGGETGGPAHQSQSQLPPVAAVSVSVSEKALPDNPKGQMPLSPNPEAAEAGTEACRPATSEAPKQLFPAQ